MEENMKHILCIVLIPCVLILITSAGCMAPQAVIKQGVNLNAYKYVYIHPVKGTKGKPDKYNADEWLRERREEV